MDKTNVALATEANRSNLSKKRLMRRLHLSPYALAPKRPVAQPALEGARSLVRREVLVREQAASRTTASPLTAKWKTPPTGGEMKCPTCMSLTPMVRSQTLAS